jgi:hypothetical protein
VITRRIALAGWVIPCVVLAVFARPVPPVVVDISPRLALSGSGLRVRVIVEPHEANRLLRTQVDTVEGTFYVAWDEDLHGAQAPRSRTQFLDALPEGHYIVTALVARADGSTALVATAEACKGGVNVSCTGEDALLMQPGCLEIQEIDPTSVFHDPTCMFKET